MGSPRPVVMRPKVVREARKPEIYVEPPNLCVCPCAHRACRPPESYVTQGGDAKDHGNRRVLAPPLIPVQTPGPWRDVNWTVAPLLEGCDTTPGPPPGRLPGPAASTPTAVLRGAGAGGCAGAQVSPSPTEPSRASLGGDFRMEGPCSRPLVCSDSSLTGTTVRAGGKVPAK